MNGNQKLKGLILLTFTIILFSTFEVTCKLIGPVLHPFQISFFRFLCGGLVLLPFALIRIQQLKIQLNQGFWLDMFTLGLVNIVISMGLIQFGLLYTNASTTAVIFSSNPIFVAVFAALILKEPVNLKNWAGIFIGIIGVVILFAEKILIRSATGPILVLLSAVVFAWYTVLGKRLTLRGTDSLVMTSFSFIAGSLLLMPLMFLMKIPLVTTDLQHLPHLLYLGIFTSGIAYMCYFYGLANVNTSSGALVYFLKPVLAAVFSVIALQETFNANFYLGTILILAALAVVNFSQFWGAIHHGLFKILKF
jgi:drug/metabolite transporter (DMT)-like permease